MRELFVCLMGVSVFERFVRRRMETLLLGGDEQQACACVCVSGYDTYYI
jgi:hypothetical protein